MHRSCRFGRVLLWTAVLLQLLFLCVNTFGQVASSSLSGTVQDSSHAVLPGATITATNNSTGVKTTTTTNSAGVYNFPSLQPGTYKVTAEFKGFQTNTRTDVRLELSSAARLNFELAITGVSTEVEISGSVQQLLLESSSSTGTMLSEKTTTEMPLVGNNAMDLLNIMGGVVRQSDQIFGNSTQTFAGVGGNNINIQRDGIVVRDVRYADGIVSPGRINPDMVGEFRMVLSPVDAEMGRGVGQVQYVTKSGSNNFHGSGLWSVMNSALDANEWSNNRTTPVSPPNWRNINDYTVSVGGPIIKNKTFFFGTWNQTIVRQKQLVRAPALTPCARKGIFRYFSGWINGNTQTTINTTNNIQTRPVVNQDGTPLIPATNRDGTPYSGAGNIPSIQGLNAFSVLGQLTPAALAQIQADPVNCSQYLPSGLTVGGDNGIAAASNWDVYRKAYDPSGYISRFTAIMPMPNDYYIGDGLNVGDLRWVRSTPGQDTVYGNGEDNERKSITTRIDHNLNERHRLSGTFNYEKDSASAAESAWPNGFRGVTPRNPYNFAITATSTLRPTLLNEARFGMASNSMHNTDPLNNPSTGQQMIDLLQKLMPTTNFPNWKGLPVAIGPGSGTAAFVSDTGSMVGSYGISNPMGGRGDLEATWGDLDRRWSIGDTLTWTKNTHSFKGGVEVRLTRSQQDSNGWAQFVNSSNTYPYVQGGNTINSQPAGIGTKWPGMVGNDLGNGSSGLYSQAYNLMDYIVGSVGQVRQYYFVNSQTATSWNDPTTANKRLIDLRQKELSAFFKDDWKATPNLTLNLGVRWDYYGVPWEGRGLGLGIVGGAQNLFGCGNTGFSTWLPSQPTCDPTKLVTLQFIGPDSPNSGQQLYAKDFNNFGPAVGFAWTLPWFGAQKTTLRGGYQLSYVPIANADPNAGFGLMLSNAPGVIFPVNYTGDNVNVKYMDLTMIQNFIPALGVFDPTGAIKPLAVRPITERTQSLSAYDPSVVNPYIQSLTLSLTRKVGSALTLDVRYIGTLSRKSIAAQNLNSQNFIANGLAAAFNAARSGGESALLNSVILPNTLVANTASGAAQLRAYSSTRTNLATGNYAAVASTLATTNGLVPAAAGVTGALLRNSGTPEDFIYSSPQFASALWYGNRSHANYHSMQAQATLQPTHGLSLQLSYTWSRNLGDTGTITDVTNRAADYGVLASNRTHNISNYGTYTLPFGPQGYLFRNSGGAVRRIVEGWQLSWINTWNSGPPLSVTTLSTMWAGSGVDLVRPDLFNTKGGQVSWNPGAFSGRYFGTQYAQVTDPQCSNSSVVAPSLQSFCSSSLHALALASDPTQIIFQHAQPGVRGNFQPNSINGFGQWFLDMALSKNTVIRESMSLNIRVDIQNVLNHPTPSGGAGVSYDQRNYTVSQPTMDLNSTNPFGFIGYKVGHRVLSAKVRLSF